jgi:predicted RNA-binding Zn ribbon-like protein
MGMMIVDPAEAHIFELTGGVLCLDFANTVDNRPDPERRRDLLTKYPDLISWGRQTEAIAAKEATVLLRASRRRPRLGAEALTRATALREVIYRVFSVMASAEPPPSSDLKSLSDAAVDAASHRRLVPHAGGFIWEWHASAGEALDRLLWPIARSAEELLISDRFRSVRECAADTCGWLFLDTSRSQSRRWCDMRVCGNRAKARRFYRRARRRHTR